MLIRREGNGLLALNLEIKVRCDRAMLSRVLAVCAANGSSNPTLLEQHDTYFVVPNGRLKLRQIQFGNEHAAELIQYRRPDQTGVRLSAYRRTTIPPEESESLRQSLEDALGGLVVVAKVRTVLLIGATRVHLDDVQNLGTFIELETVLGESDADGTIGQEEHDRIVAMLGLNDLETIPGSYSDLLIEKGTHQ